MANNPKTHTALHVVKGAVQRVLGTASTTSVYEQGNNGRLTVECSKKPTDKEIQQVQEEINNKIHEKSPVDFFQMERAEAEKKFGSAIYDKFLVPQHIRILKIVQIKDWNINCCACEHTKTTDEIGKIKIVKHRFRDAKQQLEVSFAVE